MTNAPTAGERKMNEYVKGLSAAWEAINALIVPGELPEHERERRNGLILAANAVANLDENGAETDETQRTPQSPPQEPKAPEAGH